MANEASCIEAPKVIKRVTVADGTGIAKGTILQLSSDPDTGTASSGDGDIFAGIALEEKTASDGITNLAVALDGVFDIACNAGVAVTLGHMVVLSGANLIRDAVAADLLTGATFGKALESGATSEVIKVRLGLN